MNVHVQTEGRVTEGVLLQVDDLRTHFRTERGLVRAVDGVTFTLERGKALGIVGESGSGKTVLSRTIMGLLPSTAVLSGSVRFAGQEVLGLDAKQMRHLWGREMSMVFQNPMVSLNPLMKLGKQIAEPLQIHLGMDKVNATETAERLLRDVRIPEPEKRLDQFPHELSGGMRQRVMIAIALACGPTLLFADEPTTALDVTVQAQILDLIGEQRRDRNMSVILVTHDLGVVAGHTDEIAVMYGGRLVEKAPTRELFANMKMPYTKSLMRSIPKLDHASHTRLLTIPGRPPDLVNPPAGCRFAPRCAYARDRCREEEPPLTTVAGRNDHVYACWYPVGSPEFEERDAEIMTAVSVSGGGD
ncbi:MAG: ABC transporter ATP-binding protein [Ilumatobacter sp.]|uniref:ABC transporter ATP-binding protein n=1 Tax=Ilumatobacter sp. TaxID=1967498 RepID=UPI0026069196|nr:ABC transporter ATP-binding protein [Ilumatobacter sp.]MDJ0767306.1 ABC transporter ATP-binding protein [Ilumatobacter sp.]